MTKRRDVVPNATVGDCHRHSHLVILGLDPRIHASPSQRNRIGAGETGMKRRLAGRQTADFIQAAFTQIRSPIHALSNRRILSALPSREPGLEPGSGRAAVTLPHGVVTMGM